MKEKKSLELLKNEIDGLIIADKKPLISFENHLTDTQPIISDANFKAQFDVKVKVLFYTENAGVYTLRTAAYMLANHAALATQLPLVVFGNGDFAAGYRKAFSQMPLNGWSYANNAPFIAGRDVARCSFSDLSTAVVAQFQRGDMVIPVTAIDAATNCVALVVVNCSQAAYATLLDSINSDTFLINKIRYIVPDTLLPQFDNAVNIDMQSLFGKYIHNDVSPTSFKSPQQFQNGIIDIPVLKNVDKNTFLWTYLDYNLTSMQWSVFVQSFNKLV